MEGDRGASMSVVAAEKMHLEAERKTGLGKEWRIRRKVDLRSMSRLI